jgi:phytoene desaturase
MADYACGKGAEIRLNSPVRQILKEKNRACGVILDSGERIEADAVVMNADFGTGMTTLLPDGQSRRWSHERVKKADYSCSTYMLYLGVNRLYDHIPHHTIVMGNDYERTVKEIFEARRLPSEISFYVRNSSATDGTVAPKGHSQLYVLVPVPNNDSGIDWKTEAPVFRKTVLDNIEQRLGLTGLNSSIVSLKEITPLDWAKRGVYKGATFNLSHSLDQMLYLRPHNRFEEVPGLYLVGGGTHPGSGLPTIYESARISADLLSEDLNITNR